MPDFSDLQEPLRQAAQRQGPERFVWLAAVLTRAFLRLGLPETMTPVIVGGAAVEYYTEGAFATDDLDAVLGAEPADEALVMAGLGFVRQGKDWVHPALDLYVEYPARWLHDEWAREPDAIEVDGVRVRIVSREAIILDRMQAFQWWGHGRDGVAVLALMQQAPDLDWDFLAFYARVEGVWALLAALRAYGQGVDWANPPPAAQLEDGLFYLKRPEALRDSRGREQDHDDEPTDP